MFSRLRGPGLYFFLPCIENVSKVDLRMFMLDINLKDVLTLDSISASVGVAVYYKIFDPTKSITKISNFTNSTKMLSSTTLLSMFSKKNFQEMLMEKESISKCLKRILNSKLGDWYGSTFFFNF